MPFRTASIVLFFTFFMTRPVTGQRPDLCPRSDSKKAVKLSEDARKAIKSKEDYKKIKEIIAESLKEDSVYFEPYLLLGDLAFAKKDWITMKDSYRNLIRICPDADEKAHFRMGSYLYDTKKYQEATSYLKSYLEFSGADENMNRQAELLLFRAKMILNPVPFNPVPVKGVSTPDPEYLASISPDNETFFFTRRFDESKRGSLTPTSVEKFMFSIRETDSTFSKGEPMPLPFNQSNSNNEGGPTISKDNRIVFCTKNDNGNFDIFYSEKIKDQWGPLTNLGVDVNDKKQWDSQPTLSSDGKEVYFASYRDSVYGTCDILVTNRINGKFSKPKKLPFNTNGNDKSPFIHPDNTTFYFSSDSLPGMGGFDIFMVKKDTKGNWGKPVNLGYPINTEADEVGFFVSTDGNKGYFASNKLSGTGGYDIFSFDMPSDRKPEKILFVKGNLKDENDAAPLTAKIELKNISTSEIIDLEYDSLTGNYASVVKFDSDYIMTVKGEGMAYNSHYFSRTDSSSGIVATADFEVKKVKIGEPYSINDILFATNSSDLNQSTKNIIKDFSVYLKENPSFKILIQGHTDNAGDPNKNMTLSTERARGVYDLLVESGIKAERLSYKGFGQTRPVADNNTAEGMAKNRRTEFVIISK